jgi:hypothetical protein
MTYPFLGGWFPPLSTCHSVLLKPLVPCSDTDVQSKILLLIGCKVISQMRSVSWWPNRTAGEISRDRRRLVGRRIRITSPLMPSMFTRPSMHVLTVTVLGGVCGMVGGFTKKTGSSAPRRAERATVCARAVRRIGGGRKTAPFNLASETVLSDHGQILLGVVFSRARRALARSVRGLPPCVFWIHFEIPSIR